MTARAEGIEPDRTQLQQLGDALDERSDYRWLIENVAVPTMARLPGQDRWLLDSVRKLRQVEHFRERFGACVTHAHFEAPEAILKTRYEARLAAGGEYHGGTPYETALDHPNERSARALRLVADVVLDTSVLTPEQAAQELLSDRKGIRS
jgi:hypothetical protein